MDNIALIIRELSNPSSNIDDFTIYRGLMDIIEYYNALARRKRVPTKKVPVYNNCMNHALLKRLINNVLRDIDRIKDIREEKILTGVTFVDGKFTAGIWDYALVENTTDRLIVKLNAEAFSNQFTGASVTLGYKEMPYERLIDTEGKEYITVSYKGLFPKSENEQASLLPAEVTSLTIDNWTNNNIVTMHFMFAYCNSLTSLTLGPNFNTSSVTDMNGMFAKCSALTSLTLNNFNTSNVTDMSNMFSLCTKLTSLTLDDNFNTSNVLDMQMMFYSMSALQSLTLGNNFNTSKVKNMYGMFARCEKLDLLTLDDNFNTSNVLDIRAMFTDCSNLERLTLSIKFNTSNIRIDRINGMFTGCAKLTLVLYQASKSIIKLLPEATWYVNNLDTNSIKTYGSNVIEPDWSSFTEPENWATVPLTLSRTIQTQE